jgi:hypothetical protein
MLGLPDDYLQVYRDQVQAVTREQIQTVAEKYVKPDEAAVVIVGDGAQILDQVEPYCANIEFFSTAGTRKDRPSPAQAAASEPSLAGTWELIVQTPFGRDIPARLTLNGSGDSFTGEVDSEMGQGHLHDIKLSGNEFQATVAFDMDGQAVSAQIEGTIQGSHMEGNIILQNLPSLPFSGNRT